MEFEPDGTLLGWKVTPVDAAGVYVPGGRAVYPSTLLMNVIPAQVAGVPRLVIVSPPNRETGFPIIWFAVQPPWSVLKRSMRLAVHNLLQRLPTVRSPSREL